MDLVLGSSQVLLLTKNHTLNVTCYSRFDLEWVGSSHIFLSSKASTKAVLSEGMPNIRPGSGQYENLMSFAAKLGCILDFRKYFTTPTSPQSTTHYVK